jgi:hypothetical protein
MKKITTGFLFYLCFSLSVSAQTPILLKGTIGSYPIILQLTISDDTSAYVTYFYESKRKNIEMNGKVQKDSSISVVCYNNFDERFTNKSEKIELKKIKDHYTGKWISTRKSFPIDLTPLSLEDINHPFAHDVSIEKLRTESPLDYVRTSGFLLIKNSTTRKNGFFLDWFHEKYSRVKLFRLREKVMTPSINKVNIALEEIQLGLGISLLSCSSSIGETEYDLDIDHIFLNNDLLSIDISTGYYCGGAHPDFAFVGYNFDLNSGSPLELDDVLWFGKEQKPGIDSDEWYRYRDSVFAPKVVALLKQLYPKQMKKRTNEDACDYSDPEVWNFPNWYFNSKGLYLGAYFYRAARSCDEPRWSIIPYKIVRKYLHGSLNIKLPD